MKYLFTIFTLLFISVQTFSQDVKNYNLDNGVVAEGYDVVCYFSNKAMKGKKSKSYTYKDLTFYFATNKNLETFKGNPEMYIPQYGGYCAYAIAKKSEKVSINPKTFEIRNGKLYLFYNAFFTNTLDMWLNDNPDTLQKQADINWIEMTK